MQPFENVRNGRNGPTLPNHFQPFLKRQLGFVFASPSTQSRVSGRKPKSPLHFLHIQCVRPAIFCANGILSSLSLLQRVHVRRDATDAFYARVSAGIEDGLQIRRSRRLGRRYRQNRDIRPEESMPTHRRKVNRVDDRRLPV